MTRIRLDKNLEKSLTPNSVIMSDSANEYQTRTEQEARDILKISSIEKGNGAPTVNPANLTRVNLWIDTSKPTEVISHWWNPQALPAPGAWESLASGSIARLSATIPIASATDNDNDTVIVTSDGTATGKPMSIWVFDKESNKWYDTKTTSVKYGIAVPIVTVTDVTNDIFVQTSDGTANGTVLNSFVFDRTIPKWVSLSSPAKDFWVDTTATRQLPDGTNDLTEGIVHKGAVHMGANQQNPLIAEGFHHEAIVSYNGNGTFASQVIKTEIPIDSNIMPVIQITGYGYSAASSIDLKIFGYIYSSPSGAILSSGWTSSGSISPIVVRAGFNAGKLELELTWAAGAQYDNRFEVSAYCDGNGNSPATYFQGWSVVNGIFSGTTNVVNLSKKFSDGSSDFWKTQTTNLLPDGVNDQTDAIERVGEVKIIGFTGGVSNLTLGSLKGAVPSNDISNNGINSTTIGTDNNGKVILSNSLFVKDSRAVNSLPQAYSPAVTEEFKNATVIGLDTIGALNIPAFVSLKTTRIYGYGADMTGGLTFQSVQLTDGREFFRSATSPTVWGAWVLKNKLASEFDLQHQLFCNAYVRVSLSGEVSWVGRFITIGAGVNEQETNGHHTISMPAVGATIKVSDGTTRAVAAAVPSDNSRTGGIYLNAWESLWYRCPRNTVETFVPANFLITRYNENTNSPNGLLGTASPYKNAGEWVRICTRTDQNVFHFGTGDKLGLCGQMVESIDLTTAQYTSLKIKSVLDGYTFVPSGTATASAFGFTGEIKWLNGGQNLSANTASFLQINNTHNAIGTNVFGINNAIGRQWRLMVSPESTTGFGTALIGTNAITNTTPVVTLNDNETLYWCPFLDGTTNSGSWYVSGTNGSTSIPIHWIPIVSNNKTTNLDIVQILIGGAQYHLKVGDTRYSNLTNGNPIYQANNGLSKSPTAVVLGQDVGDATNPSAFLNNREIQLTDNFSLNFKGKNGIFARGYNDLPSNLAYGEQALYSNTTGTNNLAIGKNALRNVTTAIYNTGIGQGVLQNSSGNYNTGIGGNSLLANTTGSNNTASGMNSLQSNTTGYYNTASGVNSLLYNTTGYYNTASGTSSLQSNTTGYYNTASGVNSLLYNTKSFNIVSIGYNSNVATNVLFATQLLSNFTQTQVGGNVELTNALITSYVTNLIGLGYVIGDKFLANINGNNVLIFIKNATTIVIENSTIAGLAGQSISATQVSSVINNAVVIGANQTVGGSNDINILGHIIKKGANTGIGTVNPTANLHVIGTILATGSVTAQSYVTTSDTSTKTKIKPIVNGLELLSKIKPIEYKYQDAYTDTPDSTCYGFSAQNIAEVLPEIVTKGFVSNREKIKEYNRFKLEADAKIGKIREKRKESFKLKQKENSSKAINLEIKEFVDDTDFQDDVLRLRSNLLEKESLLKGDEKLQLRDVSQSVLSIAVVAIQQLNEIVQRQEKQIIELQKLLKVKK